MNAQGAGPRIWWVPSIMTLLMVGLHALPGSDISVDSWWLVWHLDKLLHLLAFATWALTLNIAWAKARMFSSTRRHLMWTAFSSLIFGTVLEVMQGAWMQDRMADPGDLMADVAGGLFSLVLFQVIFRAWPGRIAND